MKVICISRVDGGVSLMSAKEGKEKYCLDEWKKCHAGEYTSHQTIIGALPTDRTFREAWRLGNGRIEVDMPKAREIHRDRLRQMRAPLLAALDAEYLRADEQNDTVKKQRIAIRKQALRDITTDPTIEKAKTPEELKIVGLGVLNG